jgi:hypothetical protein
MNIPVNRANLFYQYLLWLDPMFTFTKVERSIMADLITLHYHHTQKGDDMSLVNKILVSDGTFNYIRKRLRLGKKLFDEGITKLRERGYITESGIAPLFTSYPPNNKFSIHVDFELK